MRARDVPRLSAIRLLLAAIKQQEVDERIELPDERVIATIEKMQKQRRDSLSQYEAAGRNDLADIEKFELSVLQQYLPEPLSEAEVSVLIQAAVTASGAASAKDMGKIMAILKPQLAGRADMGQVSGLVKRLFS